MSSYVIFLSLKPSAAAFCVVVEIILFRIGYFPVLLNAYFF